MDVESFVPGFFHCPPHRKLETHASSQPQKKSCKCLALRILPVSLASPRFCRLRSVLSACFQDFADAWGRGVSPLRGSSGGGTFTRGLRPGLNSARRWCGSTYLAKKLQDAEPVPSAEADVRERILTARLNRLLKNSVSRGLCRRLKPAHVRNKGLFGTTKVVP